MKSSILIALFSTLSLSSAFAEPATTFHCREYSFCSCQNGRGSNETWIGHGSGPTWRAAIDAAGVDAVARCHASGIERREECGSSRNCVCVEGNSPKCSQN